MQFAYHQLSWLLLAVPLLYGIVLSARRATLAGLKRFIDDGLLPAVAGTNRLQRRREAWAAAAALAMILALLRPQWGFTWKESTRQGVDIIVAVDVSNSMLAQDVKPDRLTRARREILDLIQNLKGDRVALISFAGTAFLEAPLTLDYGAFKTFLKSLSPELIPVQGTNIEHAVRLAASVFDKPKDEVPGKPRGRALLLITDGEDFDGDLGVVKQLAADNSFKIFVVGVGTPEGSPIPDGGSYRRDKEGKLIITRLKQDDLQELARATGGVYVQSISSDRDTLAVYEAGIRRSVEAGSLDGGRAKRFNEYYQLPLAIGIALLLLGPWGGLAAAMSRSPKGKKETADAVSPLARSGTSLLLLFTCAAFVPSAPAEAQRAEVLGREGKERFTAGDFASALEKFRAAEEKRADDHRFALGRGASYYRLGEYDKAKAAFFEAANLAPLPRQKADALYNAANSMVQLGEYQEAIKTYEDALKITPDDREKQENLAYAKRLLEQQKQQQSGDDRQQNQNQQQQQQEQEQKQSEENRQQQSGSEQGEQRDQQQAEEENKNDDKASNAGEQREQDQSRNQPEQEQNKDGNQQDEQKKQDADKENKGNSQGRTGEPEKSPQPAGGQAGSQSEEQFNEQSGEQSQGEARYDQLESLLENVEEKTGKRMKFRLQKAVRQLQEQDKQLPKKDW